MIDTKNKDVTGIEGPNGGAYILVQDKKPKDCMPVEEIKVKHCLDCRFRSDEFCSVNNSFIDPISYIKSDSMVTMTRIGRAQDLPPDWCPLKHRPILVRLKDE